MPKLSAYRICVLVTNSQRDTTYGLPDGYLDVENGVAIVVTDDPRRIYKLFRDVLAVERLGVGYVR